MSSFAVTLQSVSKNYGPTAALDDFSLNIPAQSIFALVGPDGAGKTTLLRLLAGILDFDQGDITILDRNLSCDYESIRPRIGYMPQQFGLYEDLTVGENISFFADIFLVPKAQRKQRLDRLLEFSRLRPFISRLAADLSGGMKQKLGLTCALVHSPEILLLDEPTNGVDPVSRRDFWQLLYELNRDGTTVIISSSYMDEAERASRFAMMRQGKLIASGRPGEVREEFTCNVYELVTTRLRVARDVLRQEDQFDSVDIFGKTLHLTTKHDVPQDSVSATVTRCGLEIDSLKLITPTFEDIFINLSRGSL